MWRKSPAKAELRAAGGLAWTPTCTLILTLGMELSFSGGAVALAMSWDSHL